MQKGIEPEVELGFGERKAPLRIGELVLFRQAKSQQYQEVEIVYIEREDKKNSYSPYPRYVWVNFSPGSYVQYPDGDWEPYV